MEVTIWSVYDFIIMGIGGGGEKLGFGLLIVERTGERSVV
jgi:hypothetical protein